jgi:HSP20 family protein
MSEMWSRMNRLQNELERWFGYPRQGEYAQPSDGFALSGAYPAVDLWEDADNLYVEAELPGMELSDLEILVTGGNQLALRGERKQPSVEGGAWHRRERGFGNFSRAVTLPANVDADKVKAVFHHGVLTITLPKQEESKPRKITVKAK